MKAVIMAGGEGSRLRPLTSNLPKPMVPLANRPMMEYVVDLLRSHGITEIVVTVAYMADTIRAYFGDGSEFGVSMVYATEEVPLGTAGSVRNAMEHLDERFLVISGDVLTGIAAALLAQGLDAFAAARLAAWVHGRAGDLAAEQVGEISLIATDLIAHLPRAFADIAESSSVRDESALRSSAASSSQNS